MYPMPTPPIPQFAPGASFLSQGMFPGGAGQLSQFPLQQGVLGQSGGFLSKLIGGAKAGGGGITSLMNMLQNAQKAIGVLQSVGPMVQQYGPLVKSLPALFSAMKGSGSSDEEAVHEDDHKVVEKDSASKEIQQKSSTKTPSKKKATRKKSRSKVQPKKIRKNSPKVISKGIPAPKLYI